MWTSKAFWLLLTGTAFLLGGIWTRWLLEDRLLQTGVVLIVLSVIIGLLEND